MKRKTTLLIAMFSVFSGAIAYLTKYQNLNLLPQALATEATVAQPTAKPALTVTVAQPQTSSLSLQLAANGNIAAWQEALVGSQSNGLQLREVLVNVGDVVRKGQMLAVFANEAALADVAQARATLAEVQASAADALSNAERARSLQGTEALSAQQSTQFFTAEKSAKARLEAAQASLNAQQLRLGFTQVTAPDSGIISARNATVGAVVGAGTELFRLVRQGRLEWRAEVTSSELSRLKPGLLASVTAASGTQVKGKVRMIAPTVDVQTRAALVYVDLPTMSPGNSVLPGMFAKGVFELGHSNALTAPQQAVVIRDGFAYVFRLTADNHVTQTKVQTGRRNGTQVELLAGVKAADSIVVTGAGFLADGDLVKVVKATIPPVK
jgi:RND family efflux transporter MFP subunit